MRNLKLKCDFHFNVISIKAVTVELYVSIGKKPEF
jgi:hypothetical protein